MKVLVAEDTPSLLLTTAAYIREFGHDALQAKNGEEAVTIFQREKPDLIIMDIRMPEMDGYSAASQIRRQCGEEEWIPIIFLTGVEEDQSVMRAIDAGGDDYLNKPVGKLLLHAKIRAMERIAKMRKQLKSMNEKLKKMNDLDGLTGIYNRRRFDKTIDAEWRRASRTKQFMALLLIDIDHFKLYNDYNGHLAGDDCLKKIAGTIKGPLKRMGDIACRYGGEEFGVILPATGRSGAMHKATAISKAVRDLEIYYRDKKKADRTLSKENIVSLSIGCGAVRPVVGDQLNAFIQSVDEALYAAKRGGRNRIVFANGNGDAPPAH